MSMKNWVGVLLLALVSSTAAYQGIRYTQIAAQDRQGNGNQFQMTRSTGTHSGCVQYDLSGNADGTGSPCGSGSGTVTHTGALTSGQLIKGNGTDDITVGDLTGDATTSGSLAVTVVKANGTSIAASAAADQVLRTTAINVASWTAVPDCDDTVGQHLNYDTTAHTYSCGTSSAFSGTVTSIATTTPITGGTITTTGTIACATCVTSAASLTSNLPVFGSGGQATASGTRTGNTTAVATSTGSLTSGNCAKWDASGNVVDAGITCTAGGGGSLVPNFYGLWTFTPPGAITSQTTTLSGNGGSITAGATSMNVASASGFPSSAPATSCACYVVQIGTENIKVTAGFGTTTWTIVRAYDGTTGASHNDGDTVTLLLRQWINQNTVSVTVNTNYINLTTAGTTSGSAILKQSTPNTAWTYSVCLVPTFSWGQASFGDTGLVLRESSTGKIIKHGVFTQAASPTSLWFIALWAAATSTATTTNYYAPGTYGQILFTCLRIKDDATNRIFYGSSDGLNYVQLLSQSRTLTITGDEIGFDLGSGSTSVPGTVNFVHETLTTP